MPESHDELVKRAVRWLRITQKCKPIFTEMVTAAGTTPDVIGWFYGASRLIEVKTSRSDFFADRKKLAFQAPNWSMGRLRWYLTPENLVRPDEVPDGWGLIHVVGQSIRIIVEAPERLLTPQSQEQEILMLTSAIRRLTLGSHFSETTGRWESYVKRTERQRNLIHVKDPLSSVTGAGETHGKDQS